MEYKNPKIMIIDTEQSIGERLKNQGFTIQRGTFGTMYKEDYAEECGLDADLSFLLEQEVIFINMEDRGIYGYNPIKKDNRLSDHKGFALRARNQVFDSRPLARVKYKKDIEKLLCNDRIVVIFAAKEYEYTYYPVDFEQGYINWRSPISISNYEGLKFVKPQNNCVPGKEIVLSEKWRSLSENIFNGCIDGVKYYCTFSEFRDDRVTLATNKLGEPIAFMQFYNLQEQKGLIIVLPQFEDLYVPIKNLICNVLPNVKPEFFPDFVKNTWMNQEEYILPNIKKLYEEKNSLIEEYKGKIEQLDNKIEETKNEYGFMMNILISKAYDDFLVENLIKVLQYIGYKNVVDVDKIVEGNRQEDIRILDDGRFTVVEVKGHKGNPTEDDCQALVKYISRNMKSENRTDIHGILIVNHHRIKAPLERPDPAFTAQQIKDAERDDYTLVSTWELYKAVRLMQEKLITFEDIDIALHSKGLFKALGQDWQYLGKVQRLFKDGTIACFYLEAKEIKNGDELIVENGNEYFKINIEEMQINNKTVGGAVCGDQLSINLKRKILKQANIFVRSI